MTATDPRAESVALFYKEGSSDKEYRVELRPMPDGLWMTLGFNGRRGGTLKEQKKTPTPVDYDTAKDVYDKTLKSKVKDGYTTDTSGAVYQSLPLGTEFSGFIPQLLNSRRTNDGVSDLINDDEWWGQEKHDGERRPIRVRDGVTVGINKEGVITGLPMNLVADIALLNQPQLLMDGEVMGERYVAFDLLEWGGVDLRSQPYADRLKKLEEVLSGLAFSGIEVVKTARTAAQKKKLLDGLKDHRAEGLVFKKTAAAYAPGRPASGGSQLKYKFTEDCTVRVCSQNAKKRSVGVECLDAKDHPVFLGNVTIPSNFGVPAVGVLVNVSYLYLYDGGSLFQPVYGGPRGSDQTQPDRLAQFKLKPTHAYEADDDDVGETVEAVAPAKRAKPKA